MNLVIPATPGNRMLKFALFVTNNENQLGFAKAAMFYRLSKHSLTATLRRFLPMLRR